MKNMVSAVTETTQSDWKNRDTFPANAVTLTSNICTLYFPSDYKVKLENKTEKVSAGEDMQFSCRPFLD